MRSPVTAFFLQIATFFASYLDCDCKRQIFHDFFDKVTMGVGKNSKKKIQTFFQSWTSRGDLEDKNVTMMLFSVDFLSQEEIVRVSVAAVRSRESLKVLEFYSDIMWFSAAFHCPYKKKKQWKEKSRIDYFWHWRVDVEVCDDLFLSKQERTRSWTEAGLTGQLKIIFTKIPHNSVLNSWRELWRD